MAGIGVFPTLTEHDGSQRGVQVNLTPLGARHFFAMPMAELAGRALALDELLPAPHRGLAKRLEALAGWDARFDLVERTLGQRIARSDVEIRAVAWALGRIEASGGVLDVGTLVRELGYSQKHVIDLFREQVGVPPKTFARIVRFDRLAQRLKAGTRETWAELALACGYYDQSHLVRDVKQFTGLTPTKARPLLVGFGGSGGEDANCPPASERQAVRVTARGAATTR